MTRWQPYHKLVAYKEADAFLKKVYGATACFPKSEMYNLTSQFRRAALSVVLNIVEGQARGSKADMRRFLFISRGSLAECAYLLEFSREIGYIDASKYEELESQRRKAGYLLQRLVDSL